MKTLIALAVLLSLVTGAYAYNSLGAETITERANEEGRELSRHGFQSDRADNNSPSF